MDLGQLIYIICRLFLGALATFLAILLWSRTRDTAWMLIIIGTIVAYGESIYYIVNLLGVDNKDLFIGSMPLLSILLPCLPVVFFTAAFAVMVFRKYHHPKIETREDA